MFHGFQWLAIRQTADRGIRINPNAVPAKHSESNFHNSEFQPSDVTVPSGQNPCCCDITSTRPRENHRGQSLRGKRLRSVATSVAVLGSELQDYCLCGIELICNETEQHPCASSVSWYYLEGIIRFTRLISLISSFWQSSLHFSLISHSIKSCGIHDLASFRKLKMSQRIWVSVSLLIINCPAIN
jgi:hypothetical protein